MRGSWRPNRTAIYWPPLLWPSGFVSFSFSRAAQPGGPRAPSAGWWLSLPHLVSHTSSPQLTDFLYSPSYIIVQSPTQSPTQSLEWHVWLTSSGNNCHAVHRSFSSGVSVYECTMGFLPCPIFSAPSAYAISSHDCHRNVSLPSGASLWNGMFGRADGQYTTLVDRDNDFFDLIAEDWQRDIIAPNLFILYLENVVRTSINLI